jgi:hypothetical protein
VVFLLGFFGVVVRALTLLLLATVGCYAKGPISISVVAPTVTLLCVVLLERFWQQKWTKTTVTQHSGLFFAPCGRSISSDVQVCTNTMQKFSTFLCPMRIALAQKGGNVLMLWHFSTRETELGGEMDNYTSTNVSYNQGCCKADLLCNALERV